MNVLQKLGGRFLGMGFAGFLVQSGIASAGFYPTSGRLDVPDDQYEGVRAEGRACVTIQDGGSIEDYHATAESFTAVQKGGSVDFMTVSGKSTAQICGGRVMSMIVESGAVARITGGIIEQSFIMPGGSLHVYGSELTRDAISVSGKWHDGRLFNFPVNDNGMADAVILHDSNIETITQTGPYAHYRLDEQGTLKAYDGTTFLHRGLTADYLTNIPDGVPQHAPPVLTPGMPPLTGFGTSAYMDGGVSATVPGSLIPELDQGATVSFWFKLNTIGGGVKMLLSKSSPDITGHPRAMAMCILGDRMIWVSDGGPGGPSQTLIPNKPYHVVVTYDNNGSQVTGTLYVDGLQIQGPVVRPAGSSFDDPSLDFKIGGYAGPEIGIDGLVDDVQFYDRPLSSVEVKQLFDNPGVTITDIDNDTLLDDLEYQNFGTLATSPNTDYDGDGFPNDVETEITRTDPFDFNSKLAITGIVVDGIQRRVSFDSRAGVTYQLEHSSDGTQWSPVGVTRHATRNAPMVLSHVSGGTSGVYRVAIR